MPRKTPPSRLPPQEPEDTDALATGKSVKARSLLRDKTIRRILGGNLRAQWRVYAIAIFAMIIVAGMTSATAYIMQDIIDTMTLPELRDRAYFVSGAVAAIFIAKGIASYVQIVMLSKAGLAIVAEQQAKIYAKVLGQGLAYFNERDSASLLTRITSGAAGARAVTDTILTTYIRDLISLVGLIAVMIYQQPFLTLVALLAGPFTLLGVRRLLILSRRVSDQELASLSETIKVMQETATGIRVIKAFALEGRMKARMGHAIDSVQTRAIAFVKLNALTSPLMDTLSGLAIATIVALSAVQFFGLSDASPGALMSFITALLMAYEPAKRLLRTRLQIERNLTAVERMYELLDAPDTMLEAPNAKDLPEGPGVIRFEGVSFQFGPKIVLNNLDLTFAAGKTTALVGPSGGGKSTMMNLILRMYDPTEGRILVDGMDLREATGASLRRKMAFVSQDTFLFSASVMENLRVGRSDAPDDEVMAAARVANAHDFIMEMSNGYDTQIGENGALLSGGQKQRLAIARAVLRRAPILLLDEATSALDAHSEEAVRDALNEVTRNTTTIVIAHRLSTILTADHIFYVEGGRVREEGSLQDLLALNGSFRKLYDRQFRHAKPAPSSKATAPIS